MHPSVKLILYISFFIASLWDIKTRTIPNTVHILIIAAGILHIGFGGISIEAALSSAAVIGAAMVILILTTNPLGGGDCKMLVSLAFVFGIYDTLPAITLAFALVSIFMAVAKARNKLKGSDRIPLAPFIAVGFLLAIV